MCMVSISPTPASSTGIALRVALVPLDETFFCSEPLFISSKPPVQRVVVWAHGCWTDDQSRPASVCCFVVLFPRNQVRGSASCQSSHRARQELFLQVSPSSRSLYAVWSLHETCHALQVLLLTNLFLRKTFVFSGSQEIFCRYFHFSHPLFNLTGSSTLENTTTVEIPVRRGRDEQVIRVGLWIHPDLSATGTPFWLFCAACIFWQTQFGLLYPLPSHWPGAGNEHVRENSGLKVTVSLSKSASLFLKARFSIGRGPLPLRKLNTSSGTRLPLH